MHAYKLLKNWAKWLVGRFRNTVRTKVMGIFLLMLIAPLFELLVTLYFHKEALHSDYKTRAVQRYQALNDYLGNSAAQLAIKNLKASGVPKPEHPFELNVSAVPIEDPRRAIDAVTQAGCTFTYPSENAELCFGMGNQATVGAYVFAVGHFTAEGLTTHVPGQPLDGSTRLMIELEARGMRLRWIATLQEDPRRPNHEKAKRLHFRVTGYRTEGEWELPILAKDDKEFGGSITSPERTSSCGSETCAGKWSYAFRIPLDMYRSEGADETMQWPPLDIGAATVQLRVMRPAGVTPATIFDSNAVDAVRKYSLDEKLHWFTESNESLQLVLNQEKPRHVLWQSEARKEFVGSSNSIGHWLASKVPVNLDPEIVGSQLVPGLGELSVVLTPTRGAFDDYLAPVVQWYFYMAVLSTVLVVICYWILDRILVRRVRKLTHHAQGVSESLERSPMSDGIDHSFARLGWTDELGVLATTLDQVVRRLGSEYRYRQNQLVQMQAHLRAIGHEINSPLQSLDVLIGKEDKARRAVERMLAAIKTFRNATSIQSNIANDIVRSPLDLDEFLKEFCTGRPDDGRAKIRYSGAREGIIIFADGVYLESALDGVVRNAKRFAPIDTEILVNLAAGDDGIAKATVQNQGPHIPHDLLSRIFDFGVSEDQDVSETREHSGLGLYLSLSYIGAMGGSITAKNLPERGVEFAVTFPFCYASN